MVFWIKFRKRSRKALPEIVLKIQNNNFILPEKTTVKESFENWMDTYCKEHLAKTTFETYRINNEKHIIPELGSIQLQKLKVIHIDQFLHKMLREGRADGKVGLGKSTVLKIHKILTRALNQACKLELIEKNPSNLVDPPKASNMTDNVLDLSQIRKMLEVCKDTQLEIHINLAVGLGMRRGEILGLNWSNVDFDNQTITIKEVLARTSNDVFIKEPKTDKSKRTLYIPDDIVKLLKSHKIRQLETKLSLGSDYEDNNLVCCRPNGEMINPASFSHLFRGFLIKNNLHVIRFHDLRHTYATLMMANNISPKIASSMLGHANISTTTDLYSREMVDMKNEATEKISKIIYN